MRKRLAFQLGLVMMLVLTACGDGEDAASDNGDNGEGDSEETCEREFGMQPTTQSNEYKAPEYLAEYVEKESGGRLTITIFPDAQLGDDLSMLGQVQDGSLDLTLTEMGRLGERDTRAETLMVPKGSEYCAHIIRVVYETEYGQELLIELGEEPNIRIMTAAYTGTRVTSSAFEINELADLEGEDLRVPEAETLLDGAEYVGA